MKNLVCPICKSSLVQLDKNTLSCSNTTDCNQHINIINGVPDMLSDQVMNILTNNDNKNEVETDFDNAFKKQPGILKKLEYQYYLSIRDDLINDQAQLIGHKLDVLDIGSGGLLQGKGGQGSQHFTMLKNFCRSYTGIEPSLQMVEKVNIPDGNIHYLPSPLLVRGIGEMLPFPENSYDLCLILSVLDHCVSPQQVLQEVQRVLRPGGMLLITSQNYDSWHRNLARFIMPSYMKYVEEKDHHKSRFTPGILVDILENEGYTKITSTDYGYLSFPRLRSIENMLFKFPLKILNQDKQVSVIRKFNQFLSSNFPQKGGSVIVCGYKKNS